MFQHVHPQSNIAIQNHLKFLDDFPIIAIYIIIYKDFQCLFFRHFPFYCWITILGKVQRHRLRRCQTLHLVDLPEAELGRRLEIGASRGVPLNPMVSHEKP